MVYLVRQTEPGAGLTVIFAPSAAKDEPYSRVMLLDEVKVLLVQDAEGLLRVTRGGG